MSDAFFANLFGDSEPTHIGSGWISGVLGVFFGVLGLGGALCLHFPALLTLPEARSHYPMVVIRLLIQGTIAAAFVLAGLSAILRQRKVLALTAGLLAAVALLLGGGSTALPNEVGSHYGIGFDWFLLDLLVMTVVFVPVERFWPLHRGQKTFRPEWTTDAFYFVATHLPAQLLTFLMVLPALLLTKWLAIPPFQAFVQRWPYLVQLVAARPRQLDAVEDDEHLAPVHVAAQLQPFSSAAVDGIPLSEHHRSIATASRTPPRERGC